MKKALFLTCLLFAASICGIILMHFNVNSARDQVAITKISEYGDKSAADGLTAEISANYDYHLFWNTTYRTDHGGFVHTDYQFSQAEKRENPPDEYNGVTMESDARYGFNVNMDEEQSGIARAYKELLDRTPAGEEQTERVYLKDYYDFYPLNATLDLPGNLLRWSGDYYTTDENLTWGTADYAIITFLDYFKIPVIEDETIDISVKKSTDGQMHSYGSGSTESDRFYIKAENTLTDNACYFSFDCHTTAGKIVDTSHISGGYGIYRLPYFKDGYKKDGQKFHGIMVDELEMVYPLDPKASLIKLYTNADQTKLLLLTIEEDACVLTVIDIATMATLQRLTLGTIAPDGTVWNVYYYHSFLVVWFSESQLAVVDTNKTGEYAHPFTINITDKQDSLFNLSINAVMDWDGERLVISDFIPNAVNHRSLEYCSFYLAVYDKTGLLYFGEYLSSLDVGNDPYDYDNRCWRADYAPLAVRWNDE